MNLALLAALLVAGSTPGAENCSAFSAARDELVAIPSLRIADLRGEERFTLPEEAPKDVGYISCERVQLIPLPSDYKVLAAGLPLVIVSEGRVAVLEVSEGRVHFRTLEGEFTDDEIPLIQEYMNEVQPLLNAANE